MNLFSPLLRPLLWYWSRQAKPKFEGTTPIPGLKDRVKVLWDSFAVPHLFAGNEHDLFIAQGYLHAQERLWQMELTRRFHCGRMAEVFGDRTVPWEEITVRVKDKTIVDLDILIRLVGVRQAACDSIQLLPQHSLSRLQAYCDGVNRYIETHFNSLPVEFRLLRHRPEPWRPEDCLTIGKGFAILLSTSFFTRLAFTTLSYKFKDQEAKMRSLFPQYPEWGPSITRFNSESFSETSQELLRFMDGTFYNSQWSPAGQGSNNWVIAPWKSSEGRPLLCNDPHLRMTLPPVWYLIHMESESPKSPDDGYSVWGASIPGSPCIHLGHNHRIAWGVTAALCDDADLYHEKLHPQDPDRYLVGNQWRNIEQREETIAIRGGKDIKKSLRFTHHGPILSDITEIPSPDGVIALRWTAHDLSEDFRVIYGVNRARNWSEFLESISYQWSPTLNYVYADVEGNIGYSLAGKVPLRPHAPSLTPLPGWSGEFDWKGHIPFPELPRLYNPPEGIIATANNSIADPSYPYYLSALFDGPYRIERIKELLLAKEKLSLDDMVKIQVDTVSLQAKKVIKTLQSDLEEMASSNDSVREFVQRLTQWDGCCHEQSHEAALYHVFYRRLMVNLLEPELGEELFLAYSEIYNQALAPMDEILSNPDSPWFATSSRQSLVEKSFREALAELSSRQGDNPGVRKWGEIHTLTLEHSMGRVGVLAPFFSIGPFPASGSGVTVNSGFYRHSHPYHQMVGTSLKMAITVGDWERSRYILPSGQSGHPFSEHYRDQFEMWRSGEYIQLAHPVEEMANWPNLTLTPTSSN